MNPVVLCMSHWGTLCRAIQVDAWVRKFARNVYSPVSECMLGELFFAELEKAQMDLIQQVHYVNFLEEYYLCKMVGWSRRAPLCASYSRFLMVKVSWELVVGFSSLT